MVSMLKVVWVLTCGCVLGLGLSPAMLAAERMKPDASADRKAELVKPDEDTGQSINTIKGEVLRIKGEHFYVRRSDGKEVHLHTNPTTQMLGEFTKGDRVEAKVNDLNNVLSIRQAE